MARPRPEGHGLEIFSTKYFLLCSMNTVKAHDTTAPAAPVGNFY